MFNPGEGKGGRVGGKGGAGGRRKEEGNEVTATLEVGFGEGGGG